MAHQFTGNAIMRFNETLRQLNVSLFIHISNQDCVTSEVCGKLKERFDNGLYTAG